MITELQKQELFDKCMEAQRLLKPMPKNITDVVQQNKEDVEKAWFITRDAAFDTFPLLKSIYDNIGWDNITRRGLPLEINAFQKCICWDICSYMDLFVARFSFIDHESFNEKWVDLFHYEYAELKKLLKQ